MKGIGRLRAFAAVVLAVLLSPPGLALPAETGISVEATVDSIRAGLLDTITLTVTVRTENVSKTLRPQLPSLEAFSVVNQGSSSQISTSMVNGKITRSKTFTFTYTLKPLKTGSYTIEPVSVSYEGVAYRTDPLTVTIVEGRAKTEGRPDVAGVEPQIDPEKLKNDIFILTRPDTFQILQGEQIFITHTLYSRLDIDSISLRESPDFPGFYKEDVFTATRLEGRKESYNGKLYDTTLLKKTAVYPLKPGVYAPKPLVLEVSVIFKGDDPFGFLGRPYSFPVQSNDVTVNVKPLPENSTGERFSEIVGDLSATLSRRDAAVNTGEATICYLVLKSSGNLNALSDPGIRLSKRGRVYLSDTISDRIEENGKLAMIKKFEYTIIPEESGTLGVSSREILFFDTATRGYILSKAEPILIEVSGKSIFPEKPIISSKKEESGVGLTYIKGDVKRLASVSKEPFSRYSFYVYHLVLAAAAAVLFAMRMKKESLEKNEELFRQRKARGAAMSLLKTAGERLGRKEYTPAIDLTYRAVVTYIAFKAGKHPREITLKTLDPVLTGCFDADDEAREGVRSILVRATRLKFSSGSMEKAALAQTLHSEALSSLDRLELSFAEKRKRRPNG